MKYELWNCRKRNTNSQIKQISFEVFLESLKRRQLPQPDWQTVPCTWTGKIKSRPGEFNCSCSWNGQHTSWCRSQLRPTHDCHRRHAVSSEIHRGHFMLTHISHCTELLPDLGGSGRVSTSDLFVFYWLFLGTWIEMNLRIESIIRSGWLIFIDI